MINHTDAPAQLAARGEDLVSGTRVDELLTVPAGGCALVRERA